MSELHERLESLSLLPGVKGAALFSPDGVLVASHFRGIDGEALSALSSQWLRQIDEASAKAGMHLARRMSLRAVFGSVLFRRLDELVLLAAVEPRVDLDSLWPVLEEAAASLPRMGTR